MIFSHSRQFVFFAVPKTGTHAIREALRPHLGVGDWEQQVRYGRTAAPIPKIAAIQHGHVSVRELSSALAPGELTGYFRFAFVRHPCDRFISVCAFLARSDPSYQNAPIDWMKAALKRPRFLQRVLVASQSSLLVSDNGEIGVDYVGRYEQLQESFDAICQRLQLPCVSLERRNASEHLDYRQLLDAELADRLTNLYGDDFTRFSYSP